MKVDISFASTDKDRLQKSLGQEINADKVAELIAKAGAQEMLDQASGKITLTTLAETRTHLILSLFDAGLALEDAETVVAAIFKVPRSSAKRLIEITFARFDADLQDITREAAKAMLDKASKSPTGDKKWEIQVPSTLIRKWIQARTDGGKFPNPQSARRGSILILSDETYQYLKGCAKP